mgnify:CR=1 FL=1
MFLYISMCVWARSWFILCLLYSISLCSPLGLTTKDGRGLTILGLTTYYERDLTTLGLSTKATAERELTLMVSPLSFAATIGDRTLHFKAEKDLSTLCVGHSNWWSPSSSKAETDLTTHGLSTLCLPHQLVIVRFTSKQRKNSSLIVSLLCVF